MHCAPSRRHFTPERIRIGPFSPRDRRRTYKRKEMNIITRKRIKRIRPRLPFRSQMSAIREISRLNLIVGNNHSGIQTTTPMRKIVAPIPGQNNFTMHTKQVVLKNNYFVVCIFQRKLRPRCHNFPFFLR